jgi:hypothetical protein
MYGITKPRVGFSLILLSLCGFAAAQTFVTPGANTNIIGITPDPANIQDRGLKQQQEPSCIVRPGNESFIFCAYNDLRAADLPTVQGDSWMGVSMSNDAGQTWYSRLSPGFLGHPNSLGMGFAADPSVVAIAGNSPGLAILNYIAAFRDSDNGVLAIQRWVEYPQEDQDFWKAEDEIYIVADGSEGRFIDKPAFYYLVDEPGQQGVINEQIQIEGPDGGTVSVQTPTGTLIVVYAVFTGNGGGTKLLMRKSYDNGKTWTNSQKISEEQNEVTGVSITAVGQKFVIVYRRKGDNNNSDAILSAFCSNTGSQKCGKGEVVFEVCPFDQPASGSTFRTFSFPWSANDGDRFWAFAADRRFPDNSCVPVDGAPGLFGGKPRIVAMSSADGKNWVGANGTENEAFVIAERDDGFQLMPVAFGTKGRIDVAWYDTYREEQVGLPGGANNLLVNDYLSSDGLSRVFRKADVYMTRLTVDSCSNIANIGCTPSLPPEPVRVSQYQFVVDLANPKIYAEIEAHLPNLTLYKSGTLAFNGDYISLATPALREIAGGKWISNSKPGGTNELPGFTDRQDLFVAWGDNRDVRADFPALDSGLQLPYTPPLNSPAAPGGPAPGGPAANADGDDTDLDYERPGELVAEDEPDDDPLLPSDITGVCTANNDFSRSRDSNVYGSLVRDQPSLIAPTPTKPLGTIQRMFPLVVNNIEGFSQDFCLQIANQPLDYSEGGNGLASFYQLPSVAPFSQGQQVDLLEVNIGPGSSASRAVFVTTNQAASVVTVNAYQGLCPNLDNGESFGPLVNNVQLSDGNLFDPVFCRENPEDAACLNNSVADSETHDIRFSAPILQTAVLQAPSFQTPSFQTPVLQTPSFQTPSFQTPSFQTPSFQTPSFQTPSFQTPSFQTPSFQTPSFQTPSFQTPSFQTGTLADTAETDPTKIVYQDIHYPVSADANVTTTYSADIALTGLDPDKTAVQLIAWTPNTHATTFECLAAAVADQQIIAYTDLTTEDLQSVSLPTALNPTNQDPYSGALSFFGQPGKNLALTVRIWATGTAADDLTSKQLAWQECVDEGRGEECDKLGIRQNITFGASAHGCRTNDAVINTTDLNRPDCLNSGNEKILEDKIGPAILFTLTSDLEADGPGGADVTFDISAEDNVVANPTLSCTYGPEDPVTSTGGNSYAGTFGLGLNTFNCTASDGTNETLEVFSITAVDTTPPDLTVPNDLTGVNSVEADDELTIIGLGTAFAFDTYDGTILPTNDAPAVGFPVGTHDVEWAAEDSEGNKATAVQVVTVVDTTAPTFVANPLPSYGPFDATSEDGYAFIYPLPTASDKVDTSVSVVCIPAPGFEFPLGDTSVACYAEDQAMPTPNRSPESFFMVSVTDQTAPQISAPTSITVLPASAGGSNTTVTADASGTFTVEANLQPPDGAVINFTPIVTDAVDADPDITCIPSSGSTFAEGSTTVECSAFDGINTSEAISFSILIEDTTDPEFVVTPDTIYTFEANTAGGAYVDLVGDRGLVATDRGETIYPTCEATPTDGGDAIPLPATLIPGDYDVVCSVDGATTTTISVTVKVDINDLVPPVLSIPGAPNAVATVTADATSGTAVISGDFFFGPIFPAGESISASDIVDSDVTITCLPASGTFSVGEHLITCTASDDGPNAAGEPNETTGSFTLVVEDVTAPQLEVPTNGDPAALADIIEEATSPAGAVVTYSVIASDNSDPLPVTVCNPESGTTFGFGTTIVTCTSTDASGNESSATFDVLVRDTENPSIEPPPNVTAEATGTLTELTTVILGTATADDDGDASVTITNNAPDPLEFPVGITTVTWTAVDAAGNTAMATQTVTVTDSTPPTISATDVTEPSIENFSLTPKPSIEVDYLSLSGASATDLVDQDPLLSCEIVDPGADVIDDPTTGTALISAYGTWQVRCTATDSATPANQSTETFNLNVAFAYDIKLFAPKGNIRAGSTVPLDWQYLNIDDPTIVEESGFIVPTVKWEGPFEGRSCAGVPGSIRGEDSGSSGFRYSASSATWQYSWQTPDQGGFSYVVTISPPGTPLGTNGSDCVYLR